MELPAASTGGAAGALKHDHAGEGTDDDQDEMPAAMRIRRNMPHDRPALAGDHRLFANCAFFADSSTKRQLLCQYCARPAIAVPHASAGSHSRRRPPITFIRCQAANPGMTFVPRRNSLRRLTSAKQCCRTNPE